LIKAAVDFHVPKVFVGKIERGGPIGGRQPVSVRFVVDADAVHVHSQEGVNRPRGEDAAIHKQSRPLIASGRASICGAGLRANGK